MKKIIVPVLMSLLIFGCASVPQRIDSRLNDLTQLKRSKEITIKTGYNEAFLAAINVFRDLNIGILQKDYENRVIIGTGLPDAIGSNYGIFFELPTLSEVKIIVKAKGFYYNDDFILTKIKEEIGLLNKLKQ